MTFDPSKPVQTRDGQKATIICDTRRFTYCEHEFPIVALVHRKDGEDSIITTQADGHTFIDGSENPLDLINIPEKRTCWGNVYLYNDGRQPCIATHGTREEADTYAGEERVDCVEITYQIKGMNP